MSKIIKNRVWNRVKDPKKGIKLQKLANQMLMRKEITSEYLRIRQAAEFHLGFWDWQSKPYYYGNPITQINRRDNKAYNAKPCVSVKCGYLPTGSPECRDTNNKCP